MSRKNTIASIFKHINMHNGDKEVCWEWKGKFNAGDSRPYYTISGKRRPAYSIVLEATTRPPKEKEMVLHSCDNGTAPIGCCNPNHLKWGQHQDNMNEMVERERHGLPKTVVRAILKLLSQGESQSSIALIYGISREAVSAISTGRRRISSPKKDNG